MDYTKVKSIRKKKVKQPVYCIAVPSTGNFVANGVVVRNCDALRYCVFSHFFNRHSGGMTSADAAKLEEMYVFKKG